LVADPIGATVVVVCVALVASTVLGVFHVVADLAFDLELRDRAREHSVIGLFSVGFHFEAAVDELVLVDTERLWQE